MRAFYHRVNQVDNTFSSKVIIKELIKLPRISTALNEILMRAF